ncbi:YnfC family lipoprotein, partial [Klebsiella pneumoniae]|uniref:YnfC family lipoprotein n=1 Tax=Klebsiella pneumoniae TaxID=573 RepID=UPI00210D92AF
EHFVQFVAKAREAWPQKTIIAGTVVTGEMCEELILSGADIVKVGIGPGSVCTTRVKTDVVVKKVSAQLSREGCFDLLTLEDVENKTGATLLLDAGSYN